MSLQLSDPATSIPLIGPKQSQRLAKLGVHTVRDLLYHFPDHYLDYSNISAIKDLKAGETVTVRGVIKEARNIRTKYGKQITQITIQDDTGELLLVWFNQFYLVSALTPEKQISVAGKLTNFSGRPAFISPEYELLNTNGPETIHTGRLVPVYPATYGASSKWLRSRIAYCLRQANLKELEFLSAAIREEHHLLGLDQAIRNIHFPKQTNLTRPTASESNKPTPLRDSAKKRLAFDEMLLLQLRNQLYKRRWQEKTTGQAIPVEKFRQQIEKFISNLPFSLTSAQKRVIKEIEKDLEGTVPMNRLLQGDVGSGKTIVAAAAILPVVLAGKLAVYMAPTQVLAQQQYQTLKTLFEPLGITVGLVTSTTSKRFRTASLSYSDFNILVGTHALLHLDNTPDFGLLVVDEQHRFGVSQRSQLLEKNGKTRPHLLTMTATPIPRTLGLTFYGYLDISTLDEMPPGRTPTKTWVVPERKRQAAYSWIKDKIKKGRNRAFVICPLIGPSEAETMETVKAATQEYKYLKDEVFPELRLSLLHGKIKAEEKNKTIDQFRKGEIDILVSTTVVEVGIDIPEANIIVVESAERFGLASLHQLRGRVGRSDDDSFCLLFTTKNRKEVSRLKLLEKINNGLQLAEADLKIRGPGHFFGTQQHGRLEFMIADLNDTALVERTKTLAEKIVSDLETYPALKKLLEDTQNIAPN